MNRTIRYDSYTILNIIIASIICMIIAYSAFFNTKLISYPVPSGTSFFDNQQQVISSGLSRSFTAITRLDFAGAGKNNQYGIRLFVFFVIQLVIRITALLIHMINITIKPVWVYTDIWISSVLFIIFFWPFIAETFKQFITVIK